MLRTSFSTLREVIGFSFASAWGQVSDDVSRGKSGRPTEERKGDARGRGWGERRTMG